jgi:endonuclease/exonuclease/phosphatase family metal-dependent hydrolase
VSLLRVVTFNLLTDRDRRTRWAERRALVAEGLAQLRPDLIALQEVLLPDNTAQWLADQLGGYSVHLAPKAGRAGGREAIALLSRWPVEAHATLDLLTQNRIAQRLIVSLAGQRVAVANGHFYWWVGDRPERARQIRRLVAWLRELPPELPVIVCGDFNATPEQVSLQPMYQHLRSAHRVQHGREPDYTAPTPLVHPQPLFKRLAMMALSTLANRTTKPWRGTLDYIFVSPHVRVSDCQVALNEPSPHDPTLYPSDHFGLCADLAVT